MFLLQTAPFRCWVKMKTGPAALSVKQVRCLSLCLETRYTVSLSVCHWNKYAVSQVRCLSLKKLRCLFISGTTRVSSPYRNSMKFTLYFGWELRHERYLHFRLWNRKAVCLSQVVVSLSVKHIHSVSVFLSSCEGCEAGTLFVSLSECRSANESVLLHCFCLTM